MNGLNSQFEAEVLPHLPTLQKAAFRLKRNQMDAEDLVQETLLRALRFWDGFTPGTNCRAWLLRILKNQHINDWRTASRKVILVDIDHISETNLAYLAQLPVLVSSPEQKLKSQMLVNDLYSALNRLKREYRRVLMYLFIDLPYRQIAQFTNLSLGTVRSRLHRGRKLLRIEYDKHATYNRYVAPNSH